MNNRKHSLPCTHCHWFESSHSCLYICRRFCFFGHGGVSGVDIFKCAGAAPSVTRQPETGPEGPDTQRSLRSIRWTSHWVLATKNLPESNPMRMEETRQRNAMVMQVLKEAAETNDNLARGYGGPAK
uniref:Ubiquinol-cytochrome-c reductase complex assembly factor 3 n=1 Tax=Amphiprion ocellaris TaxID=80972 RepID=A0A3Q1C405_AMPOC